MGDKRKDPIFFPPSFFLYVRERGGKRAFKDFFRRSVEYCWSEFVETRTKIHLLDEGYTYIQKMRDFTGDPKEEVSRNQGFRAEEASYLCYYASSGRDSPYYGLFPP